MRKKMVDKVLISEIWKVETLSFQIFLTILWSILQKRQLF